MEHWRQAAASHACRSLSSSRPTCRVSRWDLPQRADSPYEVDLTWSDPTGDASGFIVEAAGHGRTRLAGHRRHDGNELHGLRSSRRNELHVLAWWPPMPMAARSPATRRWYETGLLPPTSFDAFLNSSSQIMLDSATDPTTGPGVCRLYGDGVRERRGQPVQLDSGGGFLRCPGGYDGDGHFKHYARQGPAFVNGLTYYFAICKAGTGRRTPSSAFNRPGARFFHSQPAGRAPSNVQASWTGSDFQLMWAESRPGRDAKQHHLRFYRSAGAGEHLNTYTCEPGYSGV